MTPFLLVAVVSYLIGSIPSGYIAGRIAGIDIRQAGSGNIGATNVMRVLGKKYGYPVFLADFLKGLGAVGLATLIGIYLRPNHSPQPLEILAAIGCLLGNTFPVWLKFKGGKGVATSAGALFGLSPWAAVIAISTWAVTFLVTRYVSIASIIAAAVLPVVVFFRTDFHRTEATLLFYFSICVTVMIVLRHRSNLSRLIRGTEQRFDRSEN